MIASIHIAALAQVEKKGPPTAVGGPVRLYQGDRQRKTTAGTVSLQIAASKIGARLLRW